MSFRGLPNRWPKWSEEFEKGKSRSFCIAFLFSAFFVSFGHPILAVHVVGIPQFFRPYSGETGSVESLRSNRYQALFANRFLPIGAGQVRGAVVVFSELSVFDLSADESSHPCRSHYFRFYVGFDVVGFREEDRRSDPLQCRRLRFSHNLAADETTVGTKK